MREASLESAAARPANDTERGAPAPAGARIADSQIDDDRVLVRVALRDGGEQLYVIDIGSGRVLGHINLVPAP